MVAARLRVLALTLKDMGVVVVSITLIVKALI